MTAALRGGLFRDEAQSESGHPTRVQEESQSPLPRGLDEWSIPVSLRLGMKLEKTNTLAEPASAG